VDRRNKGQAAKTKGETNGNHGAGRGREVLGGKIEPRRLNQVDFRTVVTGRGKIPMAEQEILNRKKLYRGKYAVKETRGATSLSGGGSTRVDPGCVRDREDERGGEWGKEAEGNKKIGRRKIYAFRIPP